MLHKGISMYKQQFAVIQTDHGYHCHEQINLWKLHASSRLHAVVVRAIGVIGLQQSTWPRPGQIMPNHAKSIISIVTEYLK